MSWILIWITKKKKLARVRVYRGDAGTDAEHQTPFFFFLWYEKQSGEKETWSYVLNIRTYKQQQLGVKYEEERERKLRRRGFSVSSGSWCAQVGP